MNGAASAASATQRSPKLALGRATQGCVFLEAKALRRHVETDFDAHHSPDLFHGQHEVSKATSLHLARQVKQDAKSVAVAQAHWEAERAAEQAYRQQPQHPCGRPPAFERRIQVALTDLVRAEAELTRAQARQDEVRGLIRELGILYHPRTWRPDKRSASNAMRNAFSVVPTYRSSSN